MSVSPCYGAHKTIFALTTCGLEAISAYEIAQIPGVTITQMTYRRIAATYKGSLVSLLSLRTVDDVFLDVATWSNIERPRSTLERLHELSTQLDLHETATLCAELRHIGYPPTFSVTVSFVGKRNYTTEEIKTLLASSIQKSHGWQYQQDDRLADLNIRLFIDHEIAFVGIRLDKNALHERCYKQVHLTGSLKPSLAAALIRLGRVNRHTSVLDPCCGSGTIVIEAGLLGAAAYGGDDDPKAVAAARTNAQAAGITANIQRWDAQALPIATASIDCVISNLPWGRQVTVDKELSVFYRKVFWEMRRVLAPHGRIVVLTAVPELIDPRDLECVERFEISLYGQRPTILVFGFKI
ncbi:MAG TPA: methyltransferase domain-containing protein [Ktedonobacteraceae bacterium]|nr:methyltransferase domain-containing protein [Ktedonobacteraceae bacterium]